MTLARDVRRTLTIAGAGVLFTLVAPSVLELFTIINLTTAIALAVLALSLALVWGYGGILTSALGTQSTSASPGSSVRARARW